MRVGSDAASACLYREIDPARGRFAPVLREPVKNDRNPKGTRHVLKTLQDGLPLEKRRRYREWRERKAKR